MFREIEGDEFPPELNLDGLLSEFRSAFSNIQNGDANTLEFKAKLLNTYPMVKDLANRGVARAQFYLAQAYSRHSEEYENWMRQASSRGIVDAHFALGQMYLDKGELNKASPYLKRVLDSHDKYLKDEVLNLMHDDSDLANSIINHKTPQTLFFKSVKEVSTESLDKLDKANTFNA